MSTLAPRAPVLAGLLLALLAPPLGALDLDELDLGRIGKGIEQLQFATGKVTRAKEIEIGEQLSAGLLGAAPLVDDAALQQYVNRVGRWLAEQTSRRKSKWPWRFGVLETDTVNAFAAPGGHVFITRGLFELLASEAELAGVLAHEIAHVLEKHHLDALQKSTRGKLLEDALASSTSRKNRAALRKLMGAGMQLYARGLERDDEYEADRVGVVIAARAGYDPYALLDVLVTLDSLDPADGNLALMFSTHPPSGERLARLDRAMEGKLDRYASQPQVAERFLRIRERILSD